MKPFDVYPLFDITPVKAEGSYVWDEKGQRYLDFYGGHAVISIGHAHPKYVKMLTSQLSQMAFYSNSVLIPQQMKLAEKLGEMSGYPDYHFFMCNSGAEANENALKVASFFTGKREIIAFSRGFHGRTSAVLAATDDPSILAPVNEAPHIHILPFNDEQALENAFHSGIAAVIVEGIQGLGGIHLPTTSFLRKIEHLCQQYGALMILDEVQSGYGRTGKFFAHQHHGFRPHLITVAKGMGNGFPVGGVLIAPEIPAKHGMLGTTFGGNYLACTASLAVLEVIEEDQLLENVTVMGNYILSGLKGLPGIKEIRGKGLMLGIELEKPAADIRNSLLKDYKTFTGSSSNKNTIRLLPALNIGKTEVDEFIHAFKNVLNQHFSHAAVH